MQMHYENNVTIASYSFHKLLSQGMIDIYGYLESLKYRYHVPNADIWNGFLKGMDLEDFKKIRQAMDERGIVLANLCCDNAHPWSNDPDELAALHKTADKMLDAAEILGAKTVRIDLGVHEDEITEEQFEYVCKKFTEYAKRGEKAGFSVGPENHWGASRRLAVQKRMYKEVNSKAYGMLLHLGNWNLLDGETLDGNDLEAIKMAVHTHVCYEQAMRAEETLPQLAVCGYKGCWGIEHHKEINEYQGVQAQLGKFLYALSKLN